MKTKACEAQPAFKALYFRCRYGGLRPVDVKSLINAVVACRTNEVKCSSKRCAAWFLEFADFKNAG